MSDEAPVGYMERTRRYYRALGYANDYVWARHDTVPFARLGVPLAEARIGLVTTSGPADRSNRDARGMKHVWSGETAEPPARLFTHDLAWDRDSTHTDDRRASCRSRRWRGLPRRGAALGSRRISTACPPPTASGRRARRTLRASSACCATNAPTGCCCSRYDRSATRP